MERLRRLSWFERIRTGPSPEDSALLQLTRELAGQLGVRFWYRQVLWGKFDRGGVGWMFTKPVIFSRDVLAFPGFLPQAELMLPEYLKGKLSIDEWMTLITLHMVRFQAYSSGRMSKLLGTMALTTLGAFALLLLLLPLAVGRAWAPILIFPAWAPASLVSLLWVRINFRMWEFELDRRVASQLGTERVSQVLEKMQELNPRAAPSRSLSARFLAFWNPSVQDRIVKLGYPRIAGPPRPSRIPKIGLRGRATIVLVGFAVFWGSGFVAGNLYLQGETTVVCATTGCAALVVISAVGYWSAILGGLSMVVWAVWRFQTREKSKFPV